MDILCLWTLCLLGLSITSVRSENVEERLSVVESMLKKYVQVIEHQSLEMHEMKQALHEQQTELERLKLENGVLRRNQADQASILRKLLRNTKLKQKISKPHHEDAPDVDVTNTAGIPIERASRLLSPVSTTASSVQTPAVGFHAYLSHTEVNPGQHHIIAFDVVMTNVQNAYNKHTGLFICQTDGLYGFSYTVRMIGTCQGTFELVKNSEVVIATFLDVKNYVGQMVTGHAVVSLKAGDVVYVRTHPSTPISGSIFSDYNGWPHFSGWLISAF